MEYKLYKKLKEAYEITTLKTNYFKAAINKIVWDQNFEADGEQYYIKGNFTLTIQNIDPFNEKWRPTAFFDNSIIQF